MLPAAYGRTCVRCLPRTTLPICSASRRLSKVFTSLPSANQPNKSLELLPFAMWPAFPVSDYYESSANPSPIEATFPSQVDGPSPVHMPDSDIVVRLPVAVFILACRKSIRTPHPSYCTRCDSCALLTLYRTHSRTGHLNLLVLVRIPPLKSCRRWPPFSPQTRINRFVFLNLPLLSLETLLGVTTSPHAPFPTGYVTLLMCNRSPPLRLSLTQ